MSADADVSTELREQVKQVPRCDVEYSTTGRCERTAKWVYVMIHTVGESRCVPFPVCPECKALLDVEVRNHALVFCYPHRVQVCRHVWEPL